jgi:periplasmic binding family protein
VSGVPEALLRANVRWVNREEGSVARHALDTLVGGTTRRPTGYQHVVRDHRDTQWRSEHRIRERLVYSGLKTIARPFMQ